MTLQWWKTLPPVPALVHLSLSTRAAGTGPTGAAEDCQELDDDWAGAGVAGLAALVCDTATGATVGVLAPDRMISTLELGVDVAGPASAAGPVHAVASVAAQRDDHVLATATVQGADGVPFATVTAWWAVRGERTTTPSGPSPTDGRRLRAPTASCPEVPGDPTTTCFGAMLGLTDFQREDGRTRFVLPNPAPFHNRTGTLHGGAGALLAHLAAVAALEDDEQAGEVRSLPCRDVRAAGRTPSRCRLPGPGPAVAAGRGSPAAR